MGRRKDMLLLPRFAHGRCRAGQQFLLPPATAENKTGPPRRTPPLWISTGRTCRGRRPAQPLAASPLRAAAYPLRVLGGPSPRRSAIYDRDLGTKPSSKIMGPCSLSHFSIWAKINCSISLFAERPLRSAMYLSFSMVFLEIRNVYCGKSDGIMLPPCCLNDNIVPSKSFLKRA